MLKAVYSFFVLLTLSAPVAFADETATEQSAEEVEAGEDNLMERIEQAGAENAIEARRRVLLELHNWNVAGFFGLEEEASNVAAEEAAKIASEESQDAAEEATQAE